jgi:hypothetical protein
MEDLYLARAWVAAVFQNPSFLVHGTLTQIRSAGEGCTDSRINMATGDTHLGWERRLVVSASIAA